jgi:hypothetical protein
MGISCERTAERQHAAAPPLEGGLGKPIVGEAGSIAAARLAAFGSISLARFMKNGRKRAQ